MWKQKITQSHNNSNSNNTNNTNSNNNSNNNHQSPKQPQPKPDFDFICFFDPLFLRIRSHCRLEESSAVATLSRRSRITVTESYRFFSFLLSIFLSFFRCCFLFFLPQFFDDFFPVKCVFFHGKTGSVEAALPSLNWTSELRFKKNNKIPSWSN